MDWLSLYLGYNHYRYCMCHSLCWDSFIHPSIHPCLYVRMHIFLLIYVASVLFCKSQGYGRSSIKRKQVTEKWIEWLGLFRNKKNVQISIYLYTICILYTLSFCTLWLNMDPAMTLHSFHVFTTFFTRSIVITLKHNWFHVWDIAADSMHNADKTISWNWSLVDLLRFLISSSLDFLKFT